jgi:hypothetical protein
MLYRMQEGALALDGDWQDQSIHVLAPLGVAGRGVNLVVSRDMLPLGMSLGDYMAQQRQTFQRQLSALEVMSDADGALDGRPARFMELRWESEGRGLHQLVATVVGEKNALLTFTATLPDPVDAEVRRKLMATISGFRFESASPT